MTDTPLQEAHNQETLDKIYKQRQHYKTKYTINNINLVFPSKNSTYQEAFIKVCQHVTTANIAFISRGELAKILNVSSKHVERTLDRMKAKHLLTSYTKYKRQYKLIVNPFIFFKGDYQLQNLYLVILLKQNTSLLSSRDRVMAEVTKANALAKGKDRTSSKQTREAYKQWCKDKSSVSWDYYLECIELEKPRINEPYEQLKQDYPPSKGSHDHIGLMLGMNDLEFRLRYVL